MCVSLKCGITYGILRGNCSFSYAKRATFVVATGNLQTCISLASFEGIFTEQCPAGSIATTSWQRFHRLGNVLSIDFNVFLCPHFSRLFIAHIFY